MKSRLFPELSSGLLASPSDPLSPRWYSGLRDAFARDPRRIVEELFNDRQLVPDDTPPLPGEVVHSGRPITVQTLFGPIVLKRRYLHHPNSHNGRAPLDLGLDLVEHHTPAVAKLICLASANSASYHEGAETLNTFTGLQLEERSHHRLINRLAPDVREAVATLQPPISLKPIPILYVENDGTGVPSRAEELVGRQGKQPDGSAKTREAKLGCVFTQTTIDKDGAPMRDPDSTSYVGTMGDCRESGELLRYSTSITPLNTSECWCGRCLAKRMSSHGKVPGPASSNAAMQPASSHKQPDC